jgi:hypothetical protein
MLIYSFNFSKKFYKAICCLFSIKNLNNIFIFHVHDCSLEWWSYELIVLLSGLLPNPQLETSVLSVWYVCYHFLTNDPSIMSCEIFANSFLHFCIVSIPLQLSIQYHLELVLQQGYNFNINTFINS